MKSLTYSVQLPERMTWYRSEGTTSGILLLYGPGITLRLKDESRYSSESSLR